MVDLRAFMLFRWLTSAWNPFIWTLFIYLQTFFSHLRNNELEVLRVAAKHGKWPIKKIQGAKYKFLTSKACHSIDTLLLMKICNVCHWTDIKKMLDFTCILRLWQQSCFFPSFTHSNCQMLVHEPTQSFTLEYL